MLNCPFPGPHARENRVFLGFFSLYLLTFPDCWFFQHQGWENTKQKENPWNLPLCHSLVLGKTAFFRVFLCLYVVLYKMSGLLTVLTIQRTGQNDLHLFVILKNFLFHILFLKELSAVFILCVPSKFVFNSEIILKFFPNFYHLLSEMF